LTEETKETKRRSNASAEGKRKQLLSPASTATDQHPSHPRLATIITTSSCHHSLSRQQHHEKWKEKTETEGNRVEKKHREERKKGRPPSRSSSGQQPPAAPPSEPPQVSPLTLISFYCSSSCMRNVHCARSASKKIISRLLYVHSNQLIN
jgi:hypothetical protein